MGGCVGFLRAITQERRLLSTEYSKVRNGGGKGERGDQRAGKWGKRKTYEREEYDPRSQDDTRKDGAYERRWGLWFRVERVLNLG